MNLTAKQEKFVQTLVSGTSQREAYRAAYDCARMKDSSIDVAACKCLAMPKVAQRFSELQAAIEAELVSRVVWDRETAATELLTMRKIAMAKVRASRGKVVKDLPREAVKVMLDSTGELNKMFRVYESSDGDGDHVTIIIDV